MASFSGSTEDRRALEALFDTTGGLEWKSNSGWRKDPDLSRWYGVTVDGRGRVKTADLRMNQLRGMATTVLRAA